MRIDPDQSRLDRLRDAMPARKVLRPDVRGQAVLHVVRYAGRLSVILEWDHDQHGAENLFLSDAHLVADSRDERWSEIVSVPEVGRSVAAYGDRCAFLSCDIHVAAHTLPVVGVNQRANFRLRVPRVSNADGFHASFKCADELVIDALLNKQSRACGAAFAVQGIDLKDCAVESSFKVCVIKNNRRRLAAELHRKSLQRIRAVANDFFAGRGFARK